jgi:TolA-binding protein
MPRRNDVPTRTDVQETIGKHETDMDRKAVDLDKIAVDVETVRQTLESLEFGGTADGADEVESSIQRADDVTVEVFDEEDQTLEGIQQEDEQYQSDLEDRGKSAESDVGKLTDASGHIETQETISDFAKAKEGALKEVEFLGARVERARQARDGSEHLQKEHQSRVHSGRSA